MKKHPIDDLFAKKLAEHRQEPSQKAFEKFQARLQEKQSKRRGGVFAIYRNWPYYAAAASVVAALTIGVLLQNNTTDSSVAVNTNKPTQVDAVKQPASSANDTKANLSDNQATSSTVASAETKQMPATNNATPTQLSSKTTLAANKAVVTKPAEIHEKVSVPEIQKPQEMQQSLASIQVTDTTPLQALASKNSAVLAESSANKNVVAGKYNIGKPITLIIDPVEENTLAAVTETESLAEEKAEKEKSFLAKLYGEYKHFKYGEKVDLKKLGVKDVVARVDEGLLKEEREDVRDYVQRRIGRIQKRE
ncbi:hypothetical protein [Emticicia sp. 17c]|uniref:hypothetical protein n=1 Tax=Emticicia sp. 17c TaxID=3127704 RepID=UPI00301CDB39